MIHLCRQCRKKINELIKETNELESDRGGDAALDYIKQRLGYI